MNVYLVIRREAKSNGRPFPFEHSEITTYYLNEQGNMVRTIESARRFNDRYEAARIAKMYHGEYRKTTVDQINNTTSL